MKVSPQKLDDLWQDCRDGAIKYVNQLSVERPWQFRISKIAQEPIAVASAIIAIVHKWSFFAAFRPDSTGIGNFLAFKFTTLAWFLIPGTGQKNTLMGIQVYTAILGVVMAIFAIIIFLKTKERYYEKVVVKTTKKISILSGLGETLRCKPFRNLMIMGGNINVNSPVKGDAHVCGGDININAAVGEDFMSAGGNININSDIEGDVRAMGGNINIGGNVLGDLLAMGGNVKSNGSARASSFDVEPIIRMGNTYVKPGDHSEEELIEGVKKGIYLKNFTEWNIDDVRFNQKYTGLEAYYIENGKIKYPVKKPAIEITTTSLWQSVDAVGKKLELHPGTCGKGEPMQGMPVFLGGPLMRLKGIRLK